MCGLKLRSRNLLVSTVFSEALETDAGTAQIRERFPDRPVEEYEAVTRIVTMVLLAFGRAWRPPEQMTG